MGGGKMKEKRIEGVSLSYRINGELQSFESEDELTDFIKTRIICAPGTLEVKPIEGDFDHMQNIMTLSWKAAACVKGISAMANEIQSDGGFLNFNPTELNELAWLCRDFLDEIISTSEASMDVYEDDCKAREIARGANKNHGDMVQATA
jgi:hypothetical protein